MAATVGYQPTTNARKYPSNTNDTNQLQIICTNQSPFGEANICVMANAWTARLEPCALEEK